MLNRLVEAAKKNDINVYDISVNINGETKSAVIHPSNNCNNSYSVAKAFCVTAFGMLFDEKKLTPEMSVADVFGDEIKMYGAEIEKWMCVKFDDVMRHRIGFDCGFLDIDNEDIHSYGTDDFLKILLLRKLPYKPGEHYCYTDAAYYLISRTVSKISGERIDDFLMSRLFMPLKYGEIAWSKCPHGYPIGATGLYIKTCDMVKLGRVYLDGGVYEGKRIISQSWIDKVLERGYEFTPCGTGYAKGGMFGQMLYFNYNTDTAVAWHSHDYNNRTGALCDCLD